MLKFYFAFIVLLSGITATYGQHEPINRQQFFLDDSLVEVHLTTDIKSLRSSKKKPVWQAAQIEMNFGDTLVIKEPITIQPRGMYRKENCDIASLMLNFKSASAPLLSKLKKLKLVGGCQSNAASEDLLLKEYLVYKIYNTLSVMSFRVRLLRITYEDSRGKVKSYTQYAFLIEDVKDMADRNNCKEIKAKKFATESMNRLHISFVSIFQYMIGNTDWAISNYHNIKLMVPLTDTLGRPYPVPYDFDYCGLVDASYAIPDENLEIKSVRERYYRGYERTMDELEPIIAVFKEKKETIIQRINNFYLLKPYTRKTMVSYINEFYDKIEDKSDVKYNFITKALRQ